MVSLNTPLLKQSLYYLVKNFSYEYCINFIQNKYQTFLKNVSFFKNETKKIFQNFIIFILVLFLLKNSKELLNVAGNAVALAITTTVYFAGFAWKAFPCLTAQSYVNVLISFDEFLGPFPINPLYQDKVNWITNTEILKIRTQGFFSHTTRIIEGLEGHDVKNVYLYDLKSKNFWFLDKPTSNIGLYGKTTLSADAYGDALFRLGKKPVVLIGFDDSPYLIQTLDKVHSPIYKSNYSTCSAVVSPDFDGNARANTRGKLILLSVGVFLANATALALKG